MPCHLGAVVVGLLQDLGDRLLGAQEVEEPLANKGLAQQPLHSGQERPPKAFQSLLIRFQIQLNGCLTPCCICRNIFT